MPSEDVEVDIECGICLEPIDGEFYAITEEKGDSACISCIEEYVLPLFPLAFQEFNYPPTWRHEIVLHPREFKPEVDAAYGQDFIALYEKATLEYATLPALRVYCRHTVDPHDDDKAPEKGKTATVARWQDPNEIVISQRAFLKKHRLRPCGAAVAAKPMPEPQPEPMSSPTPESKGMFPRLAKLFSGYGRVAAATPAPIRKSAPGEAAEATEAPKAICDSCLGKVYACCGEPIFDDAESDLPGLAAGEAHSLTATSHICKPSTESNEPINLGVRGVDFQLCPRQYCNRSVSLASGCNHVICLCGEGFCVICGQGGLKDEDDHWMEKEDGSGCPRWNKKNALNAWFDVR